MLKYVLIVLLILIPILSAETYISVNPIEVSVAPQEQIPYIVGLVKDGEVQQVLPWDFKFSAEKGSFSGNVYKAPPVPGTYLVSIRYKTIESVAIVNVIGREPVAKIVITPEEVDLQAGESVNFTATPLGKTKNALFYQVAWMAKGGKIDSSGKFTAGNTLGKYQVTALGPNGLKAVVNINIQEQRDVLQEIVINASKKKIFVGESLQLTATAYNNNHQIIESEYRWQATSGKQNSQGYNFTSEKAGIFKIKASSIDGNIEASIQIEVEAIPAKLQKIELTTTKESIYPDATLQIISQGYDQYGNKIKFQPLWNTSGGKIDSQGNFSAKEAGIYNVQVKDIQSNVQQQIAITVIPNQNIIAVGTDENPLPQNENLTENTQDSSSENENNKIEELFSDPSKNFDDFDNDFPQENNNIDQQVDEFSDKTPDDLTNNDDIDTTFEKFPREQEDESINQDQARDNQQDYSNKEEENSSREQQDEIIENKTTEPKLPDNTTQIIQTDIKINAESISLQPGETYQFSTNITEGITWEATGGIIDNNGLFTAGSAVGEFVVIATNGDIHTKARIYIFQGLQEITEVSRLEILPKNVTIQPGESAQFSANAYDGNNNKIAIDIVWTATGGSIDNSGLYTANNTVGNYSVKAVFSKQNLQASARIVIATNNEYMLQVSPADPHVKPGEQVRFQVSLNKSNKEIWSWPWEYTFVVSEGQMNDTVYTAPQKPGAYNIEIRHPKAITNVIVIVGTGIQNSKIKEIQVNRDNLTLQPFSKYTFIANAIAEDDSVQQVSLLWRANGGKVDANGTYTAGNTPGNYTIEVSDPISGITKTINITVIEKKSDIFSIESDPKEIILPIGTQQKINFKLRQGSFEQFSWPWEYKTSVSAGTYENGTYTAPSETGEYILEVVHKKVKAKFKITVTPPQIQSFTIKNPQKTVKEGTKVKFSAEITDPQGSRTFPLEWSCSGGQIKQNGLYLASESGAQTITAKIPGTDISAQATINVIGRMKMFVEPKKLEVPAGEKLRFKITMYKGKEKLWAWPWEFKCVAEKGSFHETLYTAPNEPGTYRVKIRYKKWVKRTKVIVYAPNNNKSRIVITPQTISLEPLRKHRFTAEVYDAQNNKLSANVQWQAQGGVMEGDGTYTAGAISGNYTLKAIDRERGLEGQATISIVEPIERVVIVPGNKNMKPGQTFKFTAMGVRQNNEETPIDVNWRATGGEITPEGLFTAGKKEGRHFTVTANTSNGLSSTAKIRILSSSSVRLKIIPESTKLAPGESLQFKAIGVDSNENEVVITPKWFAIGGKISKDGIYYAGNKAGRYYVTVIDMESHLFAKAPIVIEEKQQHNIGYALRISASSTKVRSGENVVIKPALLKNDKTEWTWPWEFKYKASGGVLVGEYGNIWIAPKRPGTYTLTVAHRKATREIVLEVEGGYGQRIDRIDLRPKKIALQPGELYKFTAAAYLRNGQRYPAQISWTATGGKIDQSGTFQAGRAPGNYVVIARHQGIESVAEVVIGRKDTTYSLGLDWGRSLRSGRVSRKQTQKFIYGNVFTKNVNDLEQFRRGFIKGYGAAGLYLFQELLCHTANDFGKIYGHNLYWGNVTKNQLANFIRSYVLRLPDSCHHSFKQGFVSGYKHYKGSSIYEQIYRWAKYRK